MWTREEESPLIDKKGNLTLGKQWARNSMPSTYANAENTIPRNIRPT